MTALTSTPNNLRTALMAGSIALAMVGLGFASVPLYRIFCQVTGFGGTTMRISEAEAATVQAVNKTIVVRFDANMRGLPWEFKPERPTETVTIGARDMTIFLAKNLSDHPVTGTATFNVSPAQAGQYFSKVQCFCFTEQTLKPGQQLRMPVVYYVDPKILDDPDTKDVEEITLSYTFYPVDEPGKGS
ncbi:MAG: cytochrome c oxidase assembly protein [Sphingomonadales bacterium]|jgi:cytochrome c oxidase assembly protein subunit 11|uniref:cytochrome c oxidase assembly protein n=1 Tax=Sphingorhabdus sp. TaxID=1902408 RepID=UPI001B4D666A|nr:cytochrome c oxidase assembly protein [Sphingomonadales bacterium]MBK9431384.1 cytochrome c oxidase assembly protein [Sphingomonadales bacterium]MBP6434610.1 cytochrome c oxidase assembly protein [Sphingorhabdus sp.]